MHPYDPLWVIKLPRYLEDTYLHQQTRELELLKEYAGLPCIPLFHEENISHANGEVTPVIHMERLFNLNEDEEHEFHCIKSPKWLNGTTDGRQVAKNHLGVVKVYDLGYGFYHP